MDRGQIVKEIVTTLSAVLEQDINDVTEQTRLAEDLALDSMSVLQLLLRLEDDLDIEIDMDELTPEVLQTVGALTDHVADAVQRSKAA